MSTVLVPDGGITGAATEPRRSRHAINAIGLAVSFVALIGVCLLSVRYGAKPLSLDIVLDALFDPDSTNNDHLIVRSLRVPRTLIGLMVGAALGAAGTLAQGLTRNPLADPGLLGVNTGAAMFVVLAIYVFDVVTPLGYVWFAVAGAAVASAIVYAIGSMGRDGATPVKLALAGAAITAFLGSFTTAILLLDADTLDQFRFWVVGSLAGRSVEVAAQTAPFIVIGLLLAMGAGTRLNLLALGDDVARGLGQKVAITRLIGAVGVVLLAGAATAAAGPIVFVGLAVPHVARAITGPDYRWVMPYSIVLAPILLLGADIIGRRIAAPSEVQVGIVTAILGAPVFIYLVRTRRMSTL